MTETLEKVPFLGDLPVLGKFFQSRSRNKENTELLVIVTPELVRPIPQGAPLPQLKYPMPFLDPNTPVDPKTQATQSAHPAPPSMLPIETLLKSLQAESPASAEQPRQLTAPSTQPPAMPVLSPAAAPKN